MARSGPTLQAASESAKDALARHVGKKVRSGISIEPPEVRHIRPEDLRAGRVIRVLVDATADH